MKKSILIILISSYLILIIFSTLIIVRNKNKIDNLELSKKNFNDFFISNVFKAGSYTLSDQIKLIDSKGFETELGSIINNEYKIVLFISNLACDFCFKSELELMNKKLNGLKKDDIIIFTGFSNVNNINIIANKYKIDYKIYNIVRDGTWPDFIINQTEPTVFILSNDHRVKYLFVPNKFLPNISSEYYDRVMSIFLQQYDAIEDNNNGIYFDRLTVDVGRIEEGKDTTVSVEYKNKMDKALIISEIKTGCGCTVIDWEKKPLASGLNSQIIIKYASNSKGSFSKQILVYSNAPNNPTKLILTGNGGD